jgi:hypothetical protein
VHWEARVWDAVIMGAGVDGPATARLLIAGCATRRRMTRRSIRVALQRTPGRAATFARSRGAGTRILLAEGSAHSGGGLPFVMLSGKFAAELTAEELAC